MAFQAETHIKLFRAKISIGGHAARDASMKLFHATATLVFVLISFAATGRLPQ